MTGSTDVELPTSQEFYTWSALGTLTVASSAVVVVSNTVRNLMKRDSPWIPFMCAALVVFGAGFQGAALNGIADYAISFFNTCLLFCTATGINHSLLEFKPTPTGQMKPYGRRPVPWLSPWLKKAK